ncbi:BRO family, N-terminal domain protein [Streptococcus pyogenes]|uniref:BRO-N domain-containing protein n=1 Tax=Streptococcus pyogenes TaxID=1314 RepID=UPI00109CA763|nr:Bro-N domain-containing protein [Streptococcus pyogenes]VGX67678.1 BRO family, N-terminal domain protein [Streptococcus pyogenes]VGX71600.1 BRO family, N-terminal domain protein [Streptococcus pyogenes]VHE53644.1 BRO family, N-terminal domain protein [Streptococcus pyogenes]VHH43413.1 BRO family, N-terminal domain protein [Streptococcus pyogenes]VHI15568.1 BRO family, N-terminal domain protein [Streptococcus pyogenes]
MRRNYSKVIDELRTSYNLNLVAIGQRIGIDPRTVGKWWQGKHNPNQESRKKLNRLYREVKETMMTQVNIFEEANDNTKQVMQVITTTNFHGQPLDIYGDIQKPLFLARAVAEMIDYTKTSQGYYDVQAMLRKVDEDEKLKGMALEGTTKNFRSGQKVWFLTEHGLYEVLMRSNKPKAKEFRKAVKNILKEIRLNGYYMQGELVQELAQPSTQKLPSISDLTYIRNKLADLVDMDNLADISNGIDRVQQLVKLISL